jgi:S1-C subfamily serine protease
MSTYLETLARNLAHRPEQTAHVRLRTLLREFGYGRRGPAAVAFIRGALRERGLAADLTVRRPASLDDRVAVRLLPTAPAPRVPPVPRRPSPPRGVAPPAASSPGAPLRTPASTPSANGDESTVAEAAVQATVRIECGGGLGAGVIIHPGGLVLTARHVVHGEALTCREVGVRLADGKRRRGIVVRSHWPLDFAFLWLDRRGPFAWLPIGDPTALRVAEPLIAVGHPSALTNTVSRGVVSNPRSHFWGVECLQTDTALAEGNSGGPVLNLRGEVVAVSAWQVENLDSGKFAVPVDWFLDDIGELVSLGRTGCLKGRYCLACGHLETRRRLEWCPICGARAIASGRAG